MKHAGKPNQDAEITFRAIPARNEAGHVVASKTIEQFMKRAAAAEAQIEILQVELASLRKMLEMQTGYISNQAATIVTFGKMQLRAAGPLVREHQLETGEKTETPN